MSTSTTNAEMRLLTRDELLENDSRITEWLVDASGLSLRSTYPQIFETTDVILHGAFVGETLSSHAAVRRVPMVAANGQWLRASLVGMVATDPEARGAQLASTMLHGIADDEIAAGQDLILLWSDRWEFYAKLGYITGGVQAQAVYEPNQGSVAATESTCRRAEPEDILAITDLHADKVWRIERDAIETEMLVGGTEMDCFVSERNGEILAYACHGKGLDFEGWWHEFGGTDDAVAELLPSAMAQLGQDSATILIPPYRTDLLAQIAPQSSAVEEGIVALKKPLTQAGHADFFVDGLDSV